MKQSSTERSTAAGARHQEESDDFFKSPEDLAKRQEKHKFPCCCLSWHMDTWRGIGTIISGMMMQASLGIASIWGNIVVYETSKLRGHDPQLSLQFAIIVFPATLAVGSVAMQLGNKLMDRMGPRMQVCLGGLIWVSAVYCAQFPISFILFLLIYAVVGGIGFGIIYFVPLLCAWSYFPTKRNLVAGLILMCFSLNAILTSAITTQIVNPYNDKPDITIQLGKNTESFYATDSYQVLMLNKMWTRLAQIALLCLTLSLPMLTKKPDDPSGRKTGGQILEEAIREKELEDGYSSDNELPNSAEVSMNEIKRINSEVQKTAARSPSQVQEDVGSPLRSPVGQRSKPIALQKQISTTSSNRSSFRARESKKLRRSVESMGSSVKSAKLSENGVLVQSDLSLLKFDESYRDGTFWHVWTMITFSMMFAFFMKVAFKSYGSTIYSDDVYLTNTAKIGFLTAAISRFGWAALQEVLGFKTVYMILLLLQIGLAFSMTSISSNPTLYTIWVCTTWSCEGGQQSIFPPLAGQVYGTELGVKVNALFFTGFGISAVMGVVFNNTVVPALGWNAMFIILGCFSVVSFVMLLFFKPVKSTFIPFDDQQDNSYERGLDRDTSFDSLEEKHFKGESSFKKRRKKKFGSEISSPENVSLNSSQQQQAMLKRPLLFVSDR